MAPGTGTRQNAPDTSGPPFLKALTLALILALQSLWASSPFTIIEKGILADSLVVETIIKKYCDHSPLYGQAAGIGRDAGVEISQATLSSSVLKAGELLTGVVAAMKAELLAGEYIQTDETTVPVQSNRTKGKNHQAYLWEYSVPGSLVIYDFQMGRAREGPTNFLAPFGGRLQSDGYAAYGKTGGHRGAL